MASPTNVHSTHNTLKMHLTVFSAVIALALASVRAQLPPQVTPCIQNCLVQAVAQDLDGCSVYVPSPFRVPCRHGANAWGIVAFAGTTCSACARTRRYSRTYSAACSSSARRRSLRRPRCTWRPRARPRRVRPRPRPQPRVRCQRIARPRLRLRRLILRALLKHRRRRKRAPYRPRESPLRRQK